MHSSSDENGRNDGSSFDVSHKTQDQARVVNAGRNVGVRNVGSLSGGAGFRPVNERGGNKVQGLLKDVNDILGQNFSQKALEPLLNKVNLVLNKDFPHKTLIAAVEFDLFCEKVFGNYGSEPNVRDSDLIDLLRKANKEGDYQAQFAVDGVLKILFFYCGGTLVGVLKPREERHAERDFYLSKHPSVKKDYVAEKGAEGDVSSIVADADENAVSSFHSACGVGDLCGESASTAVFTETSPLPQKSVPWEEALREVEKEARKYFTDISNLTADDLSVLRRLLYFSWGDVSSESLDGSLIDQIANAVDVAFKDSRCFDLQTLSSFYENLNEVTNLGDVEESEFDSITAYALTCFERLMRPQFEIEEISSDSDFSAAYSVLATSIISKAYGGKLIDVDDSAAVDSFYQLFIKEVGDPNLVTKRELERILLRADGVFSPESIQERRSIQDLSRPDFIRRILCEEYPQGLNITSTAALEGFREWGRHYDVASLEKDDQALRGDICRYAIVVDGFAYSVPELVKAKIKQAIAVFMNYGSIVYYEDFFKKNESSISLQNNVVNWRVLRTLLASCCKEFVFYEYYLEKVPADPSQILSENMKIRNEIDRFWGIRQAFTVEELSSKVYIPLERVLFVLNNDGYFQPAGDGSFQKGEPNSQHDVSLEEEFAKRFKSEETDVQWGCNGKELTPILKERSKKLYVDGKPVRSTEATTASARLSLLKEEPVVDNNTTKTNQKQEVAPEPSLIQEVEVEKEITIDKTETETPKKPLSREKLNVFAKALAVNYKLGLDLTDKQEVLNFRTKVEELGKFAVLESDEELADLLQHRIGFLCDGRVYIVSKKTKEAVMKRVDQWFDGGGRLIFYSSLFNRLCEEFDGSDVPPIPSVNVLVNRLKKYYPTYAFSDLYFEAKEDRTRTIDERLREEICHSGGLKESGKRLEELADVLFIPKETIDSALKGDPELFVRRSNGYWEYCKNEEGSRKSPSVKRRSSRRTSSSN